MDFGVARLSTSVVTGSGQCFGSPSYMAPEQIATDKPMQLTCGADLFSFGVVAYEALTGRRPFLGDSVAAIVYRIVHEPAPPPRSLNEHLPVHHDEVFRRALAKCPDQRFPNALSFVTALSGEGMTLPEALLAPITVSSTAIADPAARGFGVVRRACGGRGAAVDPGPASGPPPGPRGRGRIRPRRADLRDS
jgi:serine/threonine-protein kinase